MKRLLLISPHFPPDASAGAHRARVLAPHLERSGWRPTVLTVDPAAYAGALDGELAAMLPADLDIVRAPAVHAQTAQRFGFGDLGLRALPGLWRAARQITAVQRFDAVYLTTYPVYPALLGPRLRARTRAPLIVDLQDPWTGAWGLSVGGGQDGTPDLRSRLSRRVMGMIEDHVLPACDAVTGVSSGLLQELRQRFSVLQDRPALELPIGLDPRDLDWVRAHPERVTAFDPTDGNFHLCAVGTLLPLAVEPLRHVLSAVKGLREMHPERAARLRLHFIGTSNQSDTSGDYRVLPMARELGIAALVTEYPPRIPFADALRVQLAASALLVVGSTEARYTASKIAPVLATGRPALVVAHQDSDIASLMHRIPPGNRDFRIVGFGERLDGVSRCVRIVLDDWLATAPGSHPAHDVVRDFQGPELARRLGALLDSVITP